jgi:maltooligosyltrehalose trehalohydrolase
VSVWAPRAGRAEVVIERGGREVRRHPLVRRPDGLHAGRVPGLGVGGRYRVALDGGPAWPDPASRFQPEGVHGPSEVVDLAAYRWRERRWRGRPLAGSVFYELHVGTFTREGTYAAAARRLPYLAGLGVTAIELMPLHAFPGTRNWGYDPAALWAPAHAYGRPADLQRFVDLAHRHGLAVVLDVVYNHLSPSGAYVAAFDRDYLTRGHRSEWGAGINLDGPGSGAVREFILSNALLWLTDYRFDGLRVDATRFLRDAGEVHLMHDLVRRVREALPHREVLLIAEDARNWNRIVRPLSRGGFGFDAEWSFDLHHQWHAALTGERHHYYVDFAPRLAGVAKGLRQGWLLAGRTSRFHRGRWGSDPSDVPPSRLVAYLQSHDEVGNRPRGERLHRLADPRAVRAALAVLLCAPHTPMLFMGEEWAAGTPFLFFTDHATDLGRRVAASRAARFRRWPGFRTAAARARIPDPQARATFDACRLRWGEARREPHASALRWVRRLIALRRDEPALAATVEAASVRRRRPRAASFDARAIGDRALVLTRTAPGAPPIAVVAVLRGGAVVPLARLGRMGFRAGAGWEVVATSEDRGFAPAARPVRFVGGGTRTAIRFARAGAVILRGVRADPGARRRRKDGSGVARDRRDAASARRPRRAVSASSEASTPRASRRRPWRGTGPAGRP